MPGRASSGTERKAVSSLGRPDTHPGKQRLWKGQGDGELWADSWGRAASQTLQLKERNKERKMSGLVCLSSSSSQPQPVTARSYAITVREPRGRLDVALPVCRLAGTAEFCKTPCCSQPPWLSHVPEISAHTGELAFAGSGIQLAELTWLWALLRHWSG